jgi:hypothetical protein
MTRFLPHWRTATWALAIFTALMGIWAGTAIGGGIAIAFIGILWFVGFIVLGLVWLMSRPTEYVVIRGPNGQRVTLSEKEASRRIATEVGWSYQPHAS